MLAGVTRQGSLVLLATPVRQPLTVGRRKAEQPAGEAAVALKGGGPLDYLGAEVEDALVHLRVYVQGEAAGPANQSHRP